MIAPCLQTTKIENGVCQYSGFSSALVELMFLFVKIFLNFNVYWPSYEGSKLKKKWMVKEVRFLHIKNNFRLFFSTFTWYYAAKRPRRNRIVPENELLDYLHELSEDSNLSEPSELAEDSDEWEMTGEDESNLDEDTDADVSAEEGDRTGK